MTLDQLLVLFEERVRDRYYGKYLGVVTNVEDPLEMGRLRARVPSVLGETVETGWALPCAPFGGKDRGFLFLPEVGDTVWLEFAAGDLSQPIWSGASWGAPDSAGGQDDLAQETGSEVPSVEGTTKAGPGRQVLRTKAGHCVAFQDDGDILITHGGGQAEVRLTADGEVVVTAEKILLGSGAREPLVLGEAFKTLFNTHTHPTGVGPSGQPAQQVLASHLSSKSFTE